MDASSSRRSFSRTSSVSSGPRTPITRRRNPRQLSNATSRNTPSNPSKSSVRTLRRLRTKSKTVTWINPNNDDSDDYNAPNDSQQEHPSADESSRISTQSDNEMTPSAIIDSLSLSHPDESNNNTNSQATVISDSPIRIYTDEIDLYSTDGAGTVPSAQQTKADPMKRAQILELFDECEDGTAYICKSCQSVRNVHVLHPEKKRLIFQVKDMMSKCLFYRDAMNNTRDLHS